MATVAIIGLGEAGACYARGLRDAGFSVRGFDPYTVLEEGGVEQCERMEAALDGAQLVLSLVGAPAAERSAIEACSMLTAGAVYADLNTAAPAVKRRIAGIAESGGVRFADVAVLAPVPRDGIRTPLMVSGSGAGEVARLLGAVGAPVESIGSRAGDAAERKLLRSVFMKGLAAVVLESLTAAEAAGHADWLRAQMAEELSGDARALIERLVSGSRQHAARRLHEVSDAAEYLGSLGTPHPTIDAARAWLSALADETEVVSEDQLQRPR